MTIRTQKKHVPDQLPPARLYLDDLDEIVNVLRDLVITKAAKSELEGKPEFTFRCHGKECDDIQDVPKVAKPLRPFSIEVSTRRYYALLRTSWAATVWNALPFDEEDLWNTFHRLEPIFQKRRRRWSALAHLHPALTSLSFAAAIAFVPTTLGLFLYRRTTHATAITQTLLVAAALALVMFKALRHTYLVPRHSWEPSPARKFLTEKAVGWILGPLLGALALYAIQTLIRKITHSP